MRKSLTDFILELGKRLKLSPSTLHTAAILTDNFLSHNAYPQMNNAFLYAETAVMLAGTLDRVFAIYSF